MATPARNEGPGNIWRKLFEGMADGCAYCRMIYADGEPVDWTYLAVNPAFATLTGLQDVVGRNVTELIPGLRASSPDLFEAYGRVARTGVAEDIESYVETLGIRLAIHLISAGPGHFIAIFRDSTAQDEARQNVTEFQELSTVLEERTQALRLSESQFRSLIATLQVGVLIQSATGEILLSNPKALELLGLSEDQLLGRSSFDPDWNVIHEDGTPYPGPTHPVAQAIASRQPVREAVMGVHRPATGDRVWLSVDAEPLLDAGGSVRQVTCTFTDITRRMTAEAERSRLQHRSYQAQKMESLETLVAGVAHNINNVLAIIMGTASWREPLAGQPADQEAYQSISRACLRGRDVVKSLIQFSKPALEAQAPFELHTLITQVCTFLGNTGGNKVLILATGLEEPMWVRGDAGSLNHALVNLCHNAMEAMPGGGTLTLRTTLAEPDWIDLYVEDTGCGMAPEVLAHVLEPFYTTKGGSSGAGLGLSIVHGVIKAHGGSVDITSQPGRGTSVRLRIPRIPAPVQAEAPRAAGLDPRLGKVLLVDDEEDVRFLMARMLTRAGVGAVETAAGGEEALSRLRPDALPDLIILDQNMPGMSGVQVMERVRGLYPELPILFSSGQPGIESWERLRRPGVAVISKPFTMEEIQAKLALM